jgi:hypothetical protein
MFKFQPNRFKQYLPMLSVLFVTAVTLAQSDTVSTLIAVITAAVNRQPQGF